MFRFENPNYLYGLLIILLFVMLYLLFYFLGRRKLAKYGDRSLLLKLMPENSPTMKHIKFSILMLALACFIFATANPQIGSTLEKGTRKGVDIMICMDVSNSMLAEDIRPNRLEASKMAMSHFVEKLKGDRIGLVVFAGKAFVQLPITSDYAAAKMFINNVNTGIIREQGTDIGTALDLATVSMLSEQDDEKSATILNKLNSKVIVVISDGEDHFQEATQLASEINKLGIVIHTIGIGSTRGEPIPVPGRSGNLNYKKDQDGNTVMTRLNEQTLRDIATAGKGVYIHANNANMGFDLILEEIDKMFKSDLQEVTFARYENRYQVPLLIGVILLVIESLLFVVKPRWIKWFSVKENKFSMKNLLILMIFLGAAMTANAQTKQELQSIRKGNNLFKEAEKSRKIAEQYEADEKNLSSRKATEELAKAEENYKKAEVEYRKSMETTKGYDKAHYNLGNTLYRRGNYDDAAKAFDYVAKMESADKDLRAKSYHNLGNTLLYQKKYKESMEAYKNALKLNPSDMDTKYNYEYAKQMLRKQEEQQQQNQQNQDNKDQQQNQQQNQPQQQDQQQDKDGKSNPQDQKGNQKEDPKQQQQQAADRQKQDQDKRQLDALQQNERKTKEKVDQQEMRQGKSVPQEKDW